MKDEIPNPRFTRVVIAVIAVITVIVIIFVIQRHLCHLVRQAKPG
jgi:hypothetical protein